MRDPAPFASGPPESASAVRCQWQAVSATAAGNTHTEKNLPCQDAAMWMTTPEGLLIVAVADGATSATYGHVGAASAARAAVHTLASSRRELPAMSDSASWNRLLRECFGRAQETLQAEARTRSISIDDLASTLILAAVTAQGIAVGQIGDGAVVASNWAGELAALTQPQRGEFLNETTFLISPEAFETFQFGAHPTPVSHVAAFSDGLQMLALKMPEQTPHRPFFAPLFDFVTQTLDPSDAEAQLQLFLSSPRIRQRTSDDVSLVLAGRI